MLHHIVDMKCLSSVTNNAALSIKYTWVENRRKIIFGYLKNEYGYVFVQNTQLVITVGSVVVELSLS